MADATRLSWRRRLTVDTALVAVTGALAAGAVAFDAVDALAERSDHALGERVDEVYLALLALLAVVVAFAIRRWQDANAERIHARRLLEVTGDGMYGVDASGAITFANPALCMRLGCDPATLEGQDHHRALGHGLLSGADVPGPDCPICRAVAGDEPLAGGQAVLRGCNDREIAVEFATHPLGRRRREGAVVTVHDLRPRRRLQKERQELASIVQASADLAVIGGPDGAIRWMNTSGRALLGFTAEEDITAYRIEDIFSREEMARVYTEVMPVLVREGRWRGEWSLQARDGTQIPLSVTQELHRDEHGDVAYVSGIMRDLRPRLAQEQEIRDSARRLSEAELIAGLGTWEWNLITGEVTWSTGLYVLHGMDPAAVPASFDLWAETVHPDDRVAAVRAIQGARDAGTRADFVYRALHTDGGERVMRSRGQPVADHDGSVRRMIGTLQDITERRAAEMAKDEFVSVVSHELRTPLTSIHGALGLLRAGVAGDLGHRGRRVVELACESSDRLARLINDILDIERLTAPDMNVRPEPCEAAPLLERSVHAMQPMAEQAGITLEVLTQPAEILAEPDRIQQTVANLVSNAIKFSPAGTTVSVAAAVGEQELAITVRDQGRGIPADQLEQVFERFRQVDASDSREKQGSGLGLSICRTIVEQHGGRIWAKSEPGQGSTFTFTVPLADPASPAERQLEHGGVRG